MRVIAALGLALTGCLDGDGISTDRLPRSTASAEIPAAEAHVAVDASGVRLEGELLTTVDEATSGPTVVPALETALRARAGSVAAEAARNPTAPAFKGAYAIEIDGALPAEVLLRVVETGGQVGFGKPWLVVVDDDGARHGIALTLPEVAAAQVAGAAAAGEVAVGGYANPVISIQPHRGYVVVASDHVVDPGGGLLVACAVSPCGADWPTVELNRLARRIKLDHGKDRAAIVAPGEGATVQDVVTTFDALRDDTFAGRGMVELFPVALLSRGTP